MAKEILKNEKKISEIKTKLEGVIKRRSDFFLSAWVPCLITLLLFKLIEQKPTKQIIGNEIVNKDSQRLDFLIEWLGHNDTLDDSGIDNWFNEKDAREKIDEAIIQSKDN
ncbi:hypothetical protein LCGC14_0641430 [marine sediment metagenome]|uniref:Uncharacterized protein n=1 Tax=marine sediment metagenome TaxID=412755 RepID=A0A0F9U7F8_9ZZZZ|nr:hypothetical protein [archaeon]HEC36776.1 hypothetical protein [bacterium]